MVLMEARGALVTKDELLQRVWPTVIVEENTLQSHIHALRKALGSERNLIMTVPGRGYRFVGDVRYIDDQAGSQARSEGDATSVPPRKASNLPAAKVPPLPGLPGCPPMPERLSPYRVPHPKPNGRTR